MPDDINQQPEGAQQLFRQQAQQEVKLEQNLHQQPVVPQQPLVGSQAPSLVAPPPGEIVSPLEPPPPYQEIYPVQPHFWNGQVWPPPPPTQPPLPPSHPPPYWQEHARPINFHHQRPPRPRLRIINGEVLSPNRVPSTVRWFFGTITFMMIFSIVCAFVYVLIVTAGIKL